MSTTLYRNGLASSRIVALAEQLRQAWRMRPARLDAEDLPDYLKRDLGLLGGRAAPPRDAMRD